MVGFLGFLLKMEIFSVKRSMIGLSHFMDELLTEYMLLDFLPVQSTISSSFSTEATAFCPSIEILSDFWNSILTAEAGAPKKGRVMWTS